MSPRNKQELVDALLILPNGTEKLRFSLLTSYEIEEIENPLFMLSRDNHMVISQGVIKEIGHGFC